MRAPSFVLGYHGCDEPVAKDIVLGKREIELSTNKHDWLGAGAYFWENDSERALEWARHMHEKPQHFKHRVQSPAVVGAVIDLGNCLDLTDKNSLNLVLEAYGFFREWMKSQEISMPKNELGHVGDLDLVKRFLDCAVLNFLHDMRDILDLSSFDSVRGVFTEGKPLFANSRIMAKTHIQICVRNPKKSIIGHFLPQSF